MIAQAGEQMKLIANFGNGVDHIDVTSALRRGITVTNTPGVLTEDTADMTMALILSTARRLVEGSRIIPDGQMARAGRRPGCWGAASPASGSASSAWAASARRWRAGRAPSACRSTITTAAASRRRSRRALEATYWDSLDQMLARMDFVSVNCPHTPAHLSPALGAPAQISAPGGDPHQHRARRDRRRERAHPHAGGRRNRRRRARRVRARAGRVNEKLVALAQSGQGDAAAAHGLGDRTKAASTWARR